MKTIKQIYESIILDSRIDFPQETLCQDLWTEKEGKYTLKSEVRDVILDAVELIKKQPIFNNISSVRIVGSMCSNQYTSSSDIDVHFIPTKINKTMTTEELNKKLKTFIKSNKKLKDLIIDTHPLEFYFQYNEYQDLMSAGVYDVENNEWVVEPTIVKLDFNPYDEYKEAFPIIGKYVKKIEQIFSDINKNIHLKEYKAIDEDVKKLLAIKLELKEYRRSYSSPTSTEEAEKSRQDKEWHKIDAVFKFIDKFGYLRKITLIELLFKDEKKVNDSTILELKNILNK